MTEKSGSVLVVGGGIGGMQAALDLADSGFRVHMIQKDSSIGGTMVMLDKTFPTGDCSMCMISPKMVEVGRHPNIDIHPLSEVAEITGEPGNFAVTIHQKALFVDPEKCTGCGSCEEKCPKKVPSEFEQGLANRKAIYALFSQAVPSTRVIDKEQCIYLTKGKCRACEKVCTADAIRFDDTDKEFTLQAGAVILAPGLSRHDPSIHQELGYGRWPNVVTSVQFERILSASGPFQGKITRPVDGSHPKKIAWLHCVGSRDPHNGNPWCSSVCCMYTTKQAVIAKEHDADVEPTVFYMDMRAFGKDFDRYIERAKTDYGVRYIRAMISDVRETAEDGNLTLRYEQPDGTLVSESFDMVVLSTGLEPRSDAATFAETFGIETDPYLFPKTNAFRPVESSRPGIFVTGSYQSPKDIPETVAQGSAVAGAAMSLLSEARGTEITTRDLPPETVSADDEPRAGVFVCHCGINIAQTVDVKSVAELAADVEGVVHAEDMVYACAQDSQEKIRERIAEKGLNRVVVASCTPRTHEPLFRETIRAAGLNPYLFELADIREQCSWCHMGQGDVATKKAKKLVSMSIEKALRLMPVESSSVPVTPRALVVGGGIAGLTCALSLADQGYGVDVVEKENTVGGLLSGCSLSWDGGDMAHFLASRMEKASNHNLITLHTGTEVEKSDGFVGNFITTLTDGTTVEHGAVVMATGGTWHEPTSLLYGEDPRVMILRDLETSLAETPPVDNEQFLFIQCAESRCEPRNYCSRICCQESVKHALAIKKSNPQAHVTILYREMRTYGMREMLYAEARDAGVLFVHYALDNMPELASTPTGVEVTLMDEMARFPVRFVAQRLILAAGLNPHPSTEELAKKYKLTTNSDGFLLEAHVKLRPVDFPSDGYYLTGLAHAPKNLDETISQALSAAGRAGVLLSKTELAVSGAVAKHNRDLCMSCLACVRSCPYGAPFIDTDGKVSHNEVKCVGCGICAGVCPAKAFQVNSFRDDQISAMINAAI